MARVQMRLCVMVIGQKICPCDWPSTYERADQIAGYRVDRRRSYLIIHGELTELVEWTRTCSGCDGGGCSECRGRGKVRDGMWVPATIKRATERAA